MNIKEIIVPRGVRYLSDWAKTENGYHLSDYNFPHIVDKQITGCGFTEYCIREKGVCEVICSPRRILLDNKAEQHKDEPNVIYFKNDVESLTAFDKDIDRLAGSGRKKGTFAALLAEMAEKEEAKRREEEAFYKLEALKGSLANRIMTLEDPDSCKILVTYDSFRHVKDVLQRLGILNKFFIVIDEFQSVFVDSKFKSDTEIELLYELRDIQNLCYVSATPMLEKYLDMLNEFKDLPYYRFDWVTDEPGRVTKPEIDAKSCKSVLYEINNVIKDYKDGVFETYSYIDEDGRIRDIVSNEAVIYVNSVKHICSIIKSSMLTPENTNVLCSKTQENEKKVRDAFKFSTGIKKLPKNMIGDVPVKGEPHKMFTLCTRTVYLGADFYSTCARTFIASDSNIDCLSVDISLDLPQILGRQRLDTNPWKNRATLFYRTISGDNVKDAEIFNSRVREKTRDTGDLLDIYSEIDGGEREKKGTLAKAYQRLAKVDHYRDNYVAVNRHAGSDLVPVFNNLVYVADLRTYEIQQVDFRDRLSVLSSLSEGFIIRNDIVENKVKEFYSLVLFKERMKLVCTTGFDEITQRKFLRQLPIKYESYYNILGPNRMKELSYRNDLLRTEIEVLKNRQSIDTRGIIIDTFKVGLRYSASEIKQTLGRIYSDLGYRRTPKAVDIKEVFDVKDCTLYLGEDKKKTRGYEILKLKEL